MAEFIIAGLFLTMGIFIGFPMGKDSLAREICEVRGSVAQTLKDGRYCIDPAKGTVTPMIQQSGQPANPT